MPIPRPPLVEGEIYHVYNRGIDGKIIFPTEDYYRRFLLGLSLFNTTAPVQIRDSLVKAKATDTEIKSQFKQGHEGPQEEPADKLVDVGWF